MKVLKPGMVHEYTNYDATKHCQAHIACLEKLSPVAGAELRAMATEHASKFGGIRAITFELQKRCSALLDSVAPDGLYFGAPSAQSNLIGFWPAEWIKGATPRNPKGVSDAVARALGPALLR
jgi:hypothetical protein